MPTLLAPAKEERASPIPLLLLTYDPVNDNQLSLLLKEMRVEVGSLSPAWLSFAHGVSGVVVASNEDPIARSVRVKNQAIHLTHSEFVVLDFLSRRRGTAVAAETLLRYLCVASASPSKRGLDVHICNLRRKLAQFGLRDAIVTIRDYGYAFGKVNRPGFFGGSVT